MTTQAQQAIEEVSFPRLATAAAAGDVAAVAQLLSEGCDVDERCSDGMTALMLASAFGHLDVLSVLLGRGATVDLAREDGVTALAVAAFFGRHPIVRELVARGANVGVIGRHRAVLESWAESNGLVDDTDPSLEAVILEDHREPKMVLEPEPDDQAFFGSPTYVAAAVAPLVVEPLYEFDSVELSTVFADQPAVSPASVWAPDFEEASFSNIANRIPAELFVSAEPSRSGFAPVDIAEEYAFLSLGIESDFRPPDNWEALTGLAFDPIADSPSDPVSDPFMDDDDEVTAQLPPLNQPEALQDEVTDVSEDQAMSMAAVETAPIVPDEAYAATEPEFVRSGKRARVLDESSVLPSEASFATVPLFQGATRSYSPGVEFATKLSNWRRIGVPVLLTILACVGAAWVEIRYATARNIFNSLNEVKTKQNIPTPQPAYVIPAATKRVTTAPDTNAALTVPGSSPATSSTSVSKPSSTKPAPEGAPSAVDVRSYVTKREASAPAEAKAAPPKTTQAKTHNSQVSLHPRPSSARSQTSVAESAAKPANQPKPAATTTRTSSNEAKPPSSPSGGSVRPRRVNPTPPVNP